MNGRAKFPLQIVVGAKDAASAVLARVKTSLAALRSPLDKVRGLLRLSGVTPALSRVPKLLGWVAGGALDAAKRLTALGAVGATAIGALVQRITSAGDRTIKLARDLEVSSDSLQVWRYAAESAGVPADKLDVALAKLNTRLGEARAGYGESYEALRAFGIQLVDAAGNARTLEEVLPDIADAVAGLSSSGARSALVTRFFEEDGKELVRILEGGAEGLRRAGEEARKAGAVVSESSLTAFEAFQTRLFGIKTQIEGIATSIVERLLPVLTDLGERTVAWFRAHQDDFVRLGEWFSVNLPRAIDILWTSARGFFEWFDGYLDRVAKLLVDLQVGFRELKDELATNPGRLAGRLAGRAAEEVLGPIYRPLEDEMDRLLFGVPAPQRAPEPDNRQSSVRVEFVNTPPGTRVTPSRGSAGATSLSVGYALPEVGLG